MKQSIYNTYIPVTSQEQADRLKQICLEYGLPYEKHENDFRFLNDGTDVFRFSESFRTFNIWDKSLRYNTITEEKFINLLKSLKKNENRH